LDLLPKRTLNSFINQHESRKLPLLIQQYIQNDRTSPNHNYWRTLTIHRKPTITLILLLIDEIILRPLETSDTQQMDHGLGAIDESQKQSGR
jgi:hypothetical protein